MPAPSPPPAAPAWLPASRYPKKTWWTRRRKIAVIVASSVVGLLLLLLLAAWLALPYLVRSYVFERIERRFGVKLEAGQVDAGFGSVRMTDVQVRTGDTGLPLARLAVLEAEVDVWSLLGGNVVLRRLELGQPVVEVRVRNDRDWTEVVRIGRQVLRSGKRAAGVAGPAPEVVVRDLVVRFVYGAELEFDASVPRLALGTDRRMRFDARDIALRRGDFQLARADSFAGSLSLRGGKVLLDEAIVRGGAVRWSRDAGQAFSDAPALQALSTLLRLARAAQGELLATKDQPPAGPASAPGTNSQQPTANSLPAPACAFPVEGAVRIEGIDVLVREPRLGAAPLHSAAVGGSALVEQCGSRVRLEAVADGGPQSGGWSAWVERSAMGTSGAIEASPGALDDLVRRVWPGRELPPTPAEPVLLQVAHLPGERAVRVSGVVPVPALEAQAAGHRVKVGPERAPFSLDVGPLEGERLGLAGTVELATASYAGPDGTRALRALVARLEPETRIASGIDGTRIAARVDGELEQRVRIVSDPPLDLERLEARGDVTLHRSGNRQIGLDGSFLVEGLTSPGRAGEPALPVSVAGAFDPGTWIDLPHRTAAVRGRVLADGLRIDRRGLPLLIVGPPGIELSVDVRPGEGSGTWVATGEVGVHGVTVDSPKVAREPLTNVSFDVSGTFALDVPNRSATVEQGRLRVGEVEMGFNAAFALHEGTPAFRVAIAGSRTRCQDLLDALPAPLRADLPGLEFEGSVDFHVAFDVDFADLKSTEFDLNATSRCRVVAADGAIEMERLRGTFRHEIVLPDGRTETVMTGPGSPDWVPLSEISRYMVSAVVTTEDARFFRHSGVSIADLRAAIVRDLREGRFASGGSTIDMQVVKNVFLDREKSVARKLQELILTWWLDQALDKNQIMELYLNVIEYGPAIYGIGPAARTFFGRTPADLSPLEAIYLAKLLPEPLARYRMYEAGAVSPGWRTRLDNLLARMRDHGELTEEEYQAAVHDRLVFWYPGQPYPTPRYSAAGDILGPLEEPPPVSEAAEPAEEVYGGTGGYPGGPDLW
jgi:hypothetical protein